MARLLLSHGGMRLLTRYIVIALLLLAPSLAHAQETTPPDGTRIALAQVSGLDLSQLSPGLQEDIGKLAGSPLDRQKLRELAARLEAEQPRYVAAVRVTADPDGSARVVFVVARMRDAEHAGQHQHQVHRRGRRDPTACPTARSRRRCAPTCRRSTGKPLDSEVAERLEDPAEVGASPTTT